MLIATGAGDTIINTMVTVIAASDNTLTTTAEDDKVFYNQRLDKTGVVFKHNIPSLGRNSRETKLTLIRYILEGICKSPPR